MRPELRHLRAFLAVAEHGSANRAGATLYRAQSAISRSIHKLEDELGVALFERRARGMLLTQYGRALLVRARRACMPRCSQRAATSRRSPTRDGSAMLRSSAC
jgi:DNA-binding transcriptional LysR family regulator